MFLVVLLAVTLLIAGVAGYFSIYGLGEIFSGAFWPVVIMAASLEAGKLVAASYLYRYWKKISFLMKTYLISAVIVLMVITSAGIFGFLSSAYQKDVLPLKQNQYEIQALLTEKAEVEKLKLEALERKKQIDNDIASLPNNYITGRQRLMRSYGPELKKLRKDIEYYNKRLREITLKVNKMKNENIQREVHIGPIVFIARVFDKDVDEATKYLILLLIFAFDPLAVVLTVGANIAFLEKKNNKRRGNTDSITFLKNLENNETFDNETKQLIRSLINTLEKTATTSQQLSPDIQQLLGKKQIDKEVRTGNR